MAFFKFRKAGDDTTAAPAQPESIESLRRRARHRLIGAVVLVLLGVIGFPVLFDTQPRPVAVDIPIEIPDRNKAKPLAAPAPVARGEVGDAAAAAAPAPAASTPAVARAPAAPPAAASSQGRAAAGPVAVAPAEAPKPEPKPAAPAAAPTPAPQPPQAVAVAPAAAPRGDSDAARAQALLEGKPVQAGAQDGGEGRFVVQVGAFADVGLARETRQKVEKAGLKTYTQVAETKDGKRIRVRVGPFATRAEADKAAGRIKELDLPANILTL